MSNCVRREQEEVVGRDEGKKREGRERGKETPVCTASLNFLRITYELRSLA